MIVLVVGLAVIDTLVQASDLNGTLGAFFGFVLGDVALGLAIYQSGLKTYRDELRKTAGRSEGSSNLLDA